MYAVIAVAVVILAVVLVARFDFKAGMINPSSGKTAVASFARPTAVQTIVQNPADGCEIYVDNDDNNCGHCGNVCVSGSSCSANACREPP